MYYLKGLHFSDSDSRNFANGLASRSLGRLVSLIEADPIAKDALLFSLSHRDAVICSMALLALTPLTPIQDSRDSRTISSHSRRFGKIWPRRTPRDCSEFLPDAF